MPAPSEALRARREAVVREHMEAENRHAFDVALATFSHPRYEIVATGDVYDGKDAVSGYYAATRTAFPDQRNELLALHHADDAVIVEFDLLGTHRGPLRGAPPTGRAFRCRMAALFAFDGDRIACERVYFDSATILRQLGLSPGDAAPERDGAAVRLPPPLVYLGAVILGGALQLATPVRIGLGLGVRAALGATAAALGVALVAAALGLFRRTGQDPKPWESTPEIIATGVYRFTRNPMYVGMALLQTAIGVGWGNAWILALVLPVLALVYWTAVRHEEVYLERKFGDVYRAYKSSVRRWL